MDNVEKKVMTDTEMLRFIRKIGRCELFDELEEIKEVHKLLHTSKRYPHYLKAIRVSLVAQGYDEHWVDNQFRDALEAVYLGGKIYRNIWSRGTATKIRAMRKAIVANGKAIKKMFRSSNFADDFPEE